MIPGGRLSSRRDVVVTGLGTVNHWAACGLRLWSALHEGTCATARLEHGWVEDYGACLYGSAPPGDQPADCCPARYAASTAPASAYRWPPARHGGEKIPQIGPQRLAVSVSPAWGPSHGHGGGTP